jgi:ATP-dependent DNA helicase RecQ
MQGKPVAEQEIGKQLLLETVAYSESAVCRPKLLLNYFGEIMDKGCDNCDNCLHPKEKFEGKNEVLLALKAILGVQEKFKSEHIAHVLSGIANSAVKTYNHHHSEYFGAGKEKDVKFWNAVLRQALVAGFITKDIENYGLLKMTDAGHEFIKKPYSMMLTQDHDFDIAPEEGVASGGGGTGAVDDELLHILKDLRKKMSKTLNLPPFVIFQDPSLEDMAIQYPVKVDELQNIVGVGSGKAKKYGKRFVEVIQEYVEEKDILRPQDMVVKSVVNKSGVKVYIIQNIDRKLPLDDIAHAKSLEMKDLIDEIEAIVGSGTKLNIDYYLNEIMDDEKLDEIYEYFREAETESIDEALAELGEEYFSEEEIRLVRIKFFSDLAN